MVYEKWDQSTFRILNLMFFKVRNLSASFFARRITLFPGVCFSPPWKDFITFLYQQIEEENERNVYPKGVDIVLIGV